MIITVSSFYHQVGVFFEISYKVDLYIKEIIESQLFTEYGLSNFNSDWTLNLNTTTTKETTKLEVNGPIISRKHKTESYGLWLPFYKIINSQNPIEEYIYYYFEALKIIFALKFNIPEVRIDELKKIALIEIINNNRYAYNVDSYEMPDLSEILTSEKKRNTKFIP